MVTNHTVTFHHSCMRRTDEDFGNFHEIIVCMKKREVKVL